MFNKKKDNSSLNFKTLNYQMNDEYNTNNLVVANLEYVTNDDMPLCISTKQRYLFEVLEENGKEKYREIFTGFLANKEDNCSHFNLPYAINIVPLKELVPNIKENIPKYAMLLLLNSVNNISITKHNQKTI